MKVLGLDVSTKTGYAVISDGVLASYGLIKAPDVTLPDLAEDFSLHRRAVSMVNDIWKIIDKERPDRIVIEQTNAGKFRSSQKQLEFIHCLILHTLAINEGIASKVRYVDTSRWRSILRIRLSKEQRSHNRLVKAGAVRGKITPKHLAVAFVNEKFGLSLKLKDNDIADAICLAEYGTQNKDLPVSSPIDVDAIVDQIPKIVV